MLLKDIYYLQDFTRIARLVSVFSGVFYKCSRRFQFENDK